MKYKVVRNLSGGAISFGPNDENYSPFINAGENLFFEDEPPATLNETNPKLAGVEILGVMCSATKEDQNGLTAIATGIIISRGASQTFPDTVFYFQNGNQLTITDSNFDSIYATWVPFRQSFFAA